MPAAAPTIEQVIDGVSAVLSAIGGVGTVLKRDHQYEDDVEWIDVNAYISAGSMDVWVIELEGTSPFEGQGVGELYERYAIRIRYWNLRTANADWQKEARQKIAAAVEALTGHASVFAIGGQVQLFTPETVAVQGPAPSQIRDIRRGGGQMVYEAFLRLTAEARRF
jgi:hypothetical protein